jgi:hypothetical protein
MCIDSLIFLFFKIFSSFASLVGNIFTALVSDWVAAQEFEQLGNVTNAKFASLAGLQWPNKELEPRL